MTPLVRAGVARHSSGGAGGGGGGPVLWTPAQLTTLMWWDGDDAATITHVANVVSQWNDKSGNAKHATATSTAQPTYVSNGINGKGVLRFDGTTDQMTVSSVTTGQAAYSIYALLKNVADPSNGPSYTKAGLWYFTSIGSGSTPNSHHPGPVSTGDAGILYDTFGTTVRKTVGDPTPSLANAHIYNLDSAANSYQARLNATQIFTTGTNTVGMGSTCYIGLSHISDPGDIRYEGDFAEIVIFASVLSQTNRELMEGYLAWKWGIEASLPGGHRYKLAAPTLTPVTHATWDPATHGADITLSNGNLTANQNAGGAWRSVRSTIGKSTGKHYWELTIGTGDENGLILGAAQAGLSQTSFVGSDATSYGFHDATAFSQILKWNNGGFTGTGGATWTNGDVIGIALDMDNGRIWWSKNGVFVGDPVAGTGAAFTGITGTYYAALALFDLNMDATVNFGATSFVHTPPAGFNFGLYS